MSKPATNSAISLLLFNKPFGVLCQFTDADGRDTLANYIQKPGYYAAGRLDKDSEGLLLLTNDGALQQRISHPRFKLPKTYLVQVDGYITDDALRQLQRGVKLKDGQARAISVERTAEPATLWPRNPPIRVRQAIPTTWMNITLKEGRNRQVRRMTAAVNFPTLRLIRTSIGGCSVWPLTPGQSVFKTLDELNI
ncbi:MAG: 23S rRNA pseudouridine2457 synthase [Gammaproteobacteria bacterium]|jgi:23S rRNA pseudouridine2457 synthase